MEGHQLSFDPDWCIHPGATLQDFMDERQLTVDDVAHITCIENPQRIREILSGEGRIYPHTASCLARVGGTTELWINLEKNFRDGLASGKQWTK